MFTDIKIGDTREIKRIITITEIDNKQEKIKIKWKDKLGQEREQWLTCRMFLTL